MMQNTILQDLNIDMMKHSMDWPKYPYLQLKNVRNGNESGLLWVGNPRTVYYASMHMIEDDSMGRLKQVSFDSEESIYQAGWRID